MRLQKIMMLLVALAVLASCSNENFGSLQLDLAVPYYHYKDTFFCAPLAEGLYKSECKNIAILPTDKIFVTIYTKKSVSEEYRYDFQPQPFLVDGTSGSEEFVESLIDGNYYKFEVIIKNANEKPKMTGIVQDIQYDSTKNGTVTVPLGVVGDFVKVLVSNESSEDSAMRTYVDVQGSAGSAGTVLSNGEIMVSGGYLLSSDPTQEYITSKADIINVPKTEKRSASGFSKPLMDHAMATIHDGSRRGLVVSAYGRMPQDMFSPSIYVYDPDNPSTPMEVATGDPGAHATAVSITGGDTNGVLVAGGCGVGNASDKVYWVYHDPAQPTGVNTKMTTLATGRCHHAAADISYTDDEGVFHPQVLILGGVTTSELQTGYVTGSAFAEVVSIVAGEPKSQAISVSGITEGFHVISPAAARVRWDSGETWQQTEGAVILAGGFIDTETEDTDLGLIANKSVYIFSNRNDSWSVSANNVGLICPFASMTPVKSRGITKKTTALNCGAAFADDEEGDMDDLYTFFDRTTTDNTEGGIYLLGTTYSNDLSVSIEETMFDSNTDGFYTNDIVDGPAVSDSDGQAFLLGSRFVYFVSGYAF